MRRSKILSIIEDTFEELFEYYRSDSSIRAMFRDLDLTISVKFGDTKRKYFIKIDQDRSIFLESETPNLKPDIKIRISTEKLLKDLVDGAIPISEQFKKGKILITKGFVKIAKIYRKYVGEP